MRRSRRSRHKLPPRHVFEHHDLHLPRAAHVNAAIALRLLRVVPTPLTLFAYRAHGAYEQLWLSLLLDRAEQGAAQTQARIDEHNARLIDAASLVTLPVKDIASTGIKSIDPAEIINAARRRANRGPRNHKGANRWLRFLCPTCSTQKTLKNGQTQWTNTIQASAADRLVLCAGFANAPHTPAVCNLDESSQPDYRLTDKYNPEESEAGLGGRFASSYNETQSTIQLAASHARRTQAVTTSPDVYTPNPPPLDPEDEFGGL